MKWICNLKKLIICSNFDILSPIKLIGEISNLEEDFLGWSALSQAKWAHQRRGRLKDFFFFPRIAYLTCFFPLMKYFWTLDFSEVLLFPPKRVILSWLEKGERIWAGTNDNMYKSFTLAVVIWIRNCLYMNRGAWRATVHGVTKSWTWLSNLHMDMDI